MINSTIRVLSIAVLAAVALSACGPLTKREQRTLAGGAIGATGGAILGGVLTGSPGGAAVGAVAGGVGGAAIGAFSGRNSQRECASYISDASGNPVCVRFRRERR